MFALSLHLAGVTVLALAIGGFYALVLLPLQQKQAEYSARSEQLDMLLVNTGTEASDYRRLRDELASMNDSVAEMHRQLAGQSSETAVIEQLSQLASDVDLEVLDYQVGLTQSLPSHSQTSVDFRCHGSYASICRFLQKAEQLTRTTKLSKFELNAKEKSHGYPIQLTFVLYSGGKSHDTKESRGAL